MRPGFRIVCLALPALVSAAWIGGVQSAAAQATNFRQELDDIKNAIPGLGQEHAPIDFNERAPLVVPPTNDLPPPVEAQRGLPVTDPDEMARRKALSDPRRPVPASDPGATAAGASRRAFLIDPPSGMRDPSQIADEAANDGFQDGPKRKKGTKTVATTHHHARRTKAIAEAQ